MKDIITLAVESSCDETSVAVLKNGREVLSNIINTRSCIKKTYRKYRYSVTRSFR